MKLNHADLLVHDVPTSAAYFCRLFGLELRTSATSEAIAILTDGHGFVLALQRADAGCARYPEGFHIGFLVENVAAVRALHAVAVAEGTLVSDVIVNGRGTMIYLTAPEGYRIEVSCQRAGFERDPGARVGAAADGVVDSLGEHGVDRT